MFDIRVKLALVKRAQYRAIGFVSFCNGGWRVREEGVKKP